MQHGNVQIRDRRVEGVLHMTAGVQRAAAFAEQQDRQLVVVVAVAIPDAGAVEEHHVVEQGAVAFFDCLQFGDEVGQVLGVELVDLGDLFELGFVAAVVRAVMMAFGHADELVAAVRAFVGEDERAEAGEVSLEGEDLQVSQRLHVLAVFLWDAGGLLDGRLDLNILLLVALQVLFHLADGGEVLIELAAVSSAELGFERLGIVTHRVEHAQAVVIVLGGAIEPIEDLLGIDLFGHGRLFGTPGDVVRVGTGIA